jgi:cysteine-rich repeat protein
MKATRTTTKGSSISLALLLVVSLSLVPRADALDLSGRWRTDLAGDPTVSERFVEIVQTGDDVTIGYAPLLPYEGPFHGTLTGDRLSTEAANAFVGLSFNVLGDGTVLRGLFSAWPGSPTSHVMSRCECHDGNAEDGDGCDSTCRIEPCFSCAGEPSVCTPSADGEACNDRHDCTTGETCQSGVCGAGLPVSPCIDVTGKWLEYSESLRARRYPFGPGLATMVDQTNMVQENGIVFARDAATGELGRVGPISRTTGELSFLLPGSGGLCPDTHPFTATVAPDGQHYDGIAEEDFDALINHSCWLAQDVTVRGLRCAAGSVDSGDDCLVDSCMNCSGAPGVCSPLPDGTPCRHPDPRTAVAACRAGSCSATVSDVCPPCSVSDGLGDCVAAPRDNCRRSLEPAATMLSIHLRNPYNRFGDRRYRARGFLDWRWTDGEATTAFDLGAPQRSSEVALCFFDESGALPTLLAAFTVKPGEPCLDVDACGYAYGGWRSTDDGDEEYVEWRGFRRPLFARTLLHPGPDGQAGIRIASWGGDLELPEVLPLPLRVQLQIGGGACFDSSYGTADVRMNRHSVFRTRGN